MLFSSTRLAKRSCPHLQSRSLRCEKLEGREMMATTYVILDFTPEYHAGSFVDTFLSTRLPNSKYAPNFLDFNGDHWVNAADATIAANRVAGRVAGFYSQAKAGYAVRIYSGDVTKNTNWGYQWIKYGRYYSGVEAAVMYFGGTNRGGTQILGMAPMANNGYNFEGYGETYTRSAALNMAKWTPKASTSDFVELVARVASHELGHMFGLRHIRGNDLSNIMNASTPVSPVAASFKNWSIATSGGPAQNAFRELRASFAGQYQQNNQPALGGQYTTANLAPTVTGADPQATTSPVRPALTTAEQVDWAMASLLGAGAPTLDGARAAAESAFALATARAGQHRIESNGAANPDGVQYRSLGGELAGPDLRSACGSAQQADLPLSAAKPTVGRGLPEGSRSIRRSSDKPFGYDLFDIDRLERNSQVSRNAGCAACLA